MARDDAYFRLRIPEQELEFIKAQAIRNLRSMTAEIIFTIKMRMERETETAGEPVKTTPTV